MKDFNFQAAKEFNQQIDESEQSTPEMPAFVLLDKEFVRSTDPNLLKNEYQLLTNDFLKLDVLTFIRYKNEALFITSGSQKNAEGYVLTTEKTYSDLPNMEDHYETLNESAVEKEWKQVKLKKREFNE